MMKIALVHDHLFSKGGAERVLLNFHKAFPEAPIYTSVYFAKDTYPEFADCRIITSWFNRLVKSEKQFKRFFFPLAFLAMKMLDLSEYDAVLLSTTTFAKYVRVSPKAVVISYCYTPFRLAWNPESYHIYEKSSGMMRFLLDMVIGFIRKWDFKNAQRADYYLAMTSETRERIVQAYHYNGVIDIIPPSIDFSRYYPGKTVGDYYLVVARLEKYKRVDLVIEAFNKIGLPLVIIGKGMEKERLMKMAGPNIRFYEGLSDRELIQYYANCIAFIFPQHEDYGLTPLEANACGRPVLAYGAGGVLETLIPYSGKPAECTAVFFQEQTVESLLKGLEQLQNIQFDPDFIRKHAQTFDNRYFIEKIRQTVELKSQNCCQNKTNK